jgi:hypothetical protein
MNNLPWSFYLFAGAGIIVDGYYDMAARSSHSWLRFVVSGVVWALIMVAGNLAFKAGRRSNSQVL